MGEVNFRICRLQESDEVPIEVSKARQCCHANGFFDSHAPAAVLLMVGWVFLSEGIQKFLYPAMLGVGRFEKSGIPDPAFFAAFVGVVEIVCGALLIVGLLTRLATIPLIIDIPVAIVTTKILMLAKSGFWAMMHEA